VCFLTSSPLKDKLTPGELALSCNYMATSQIINGFCPPPTAAKPPLEYILNRLSAQDKVKNKKRFPFFSSADSATTGFAGNLFTEKETGDSLFERAYDRVVELKRWFEMTPWREMISWNNSMAAIHPEPQ
jgi:hypothetical protein